MDNRRLQEQVKQHHKRMREEVETIAKELRGRAMPELSMELFEIYERTGNRLDYENVYFERRRFLVVFGLISIWHRRVEDIQKLEEIIGEICKEETWALPAHVNRKEPNWQRTVDLFASETGQALAEIISLLREDISESVYEQVRRSVLERTIDSYLSVPKGKWRWEGFYNNWTAVCAGCMGSIALYLLEDMPKKQQECVERVIKTMPDYLDGMTEDGVCPEGLSYFTYGMTYFTGFARQLYDHTGGKLDLMKGEKIKSIARFQQKCYLGGGLTVSFSDGSRADKFRLGLTCYLAMKVSGVQIPDMNLAMHFMDDHCYRWMANYRDDIWVTEYLKNMERQKEQSLETSEQFLVLPNAQWVIAKGKDGTAFACKGGNNKEPHNHNDVGSFLYCADGEEFLTDLGCGEYTKDYFGERRYQILCNRSMGHNVPILNGTEQCEGDFYRADEFFSDGKEWVTISFAGAYPEGTAKRLERRFRFLSQNGILFVRDICQPAADTRCFTENLITQKEPLIQDNTIQIRGDRGLVKIKVNGVNGRIWAEQETFINHRAGLEPVWKIQWNVTEKEQFQSEFSIEYENIKKYE